MKKNEIKSGERYIATILCHAGIRCLYPYSLWINYEFVDDYKTRKQAVRRAIQLGAKRDEIEWGGE